jgi:mRNA interferase MazF
MYVKFFDAWNKMKKEINDEVKLVEDFENEDSLFRGGEIRWAAIGVNVGSEIDGKGDDFFRPVLILEKVAPDLYFVIPMSTKIKTSLGYRSLALSDKTVSICLHQAKTISSKRIYSRIEKIPSDKLKIVKDQFKKYLRR